MGTQANRKQAAGQGGSASYGYYNDLSQVDNDLSPPTKKILVVRRLKV